MPGPRTTGPRAIAVALALCAGLTGCGASDGSGDGQVVLRYAWWGNPDRAARTEAALELFEERHPEITVQTSFSGYDAYVQKLATQAAGGDAPDVMQLDYRQIDQYASGGVLLDLGEQRDVLDTAEIDPELLETGVVDGVQVAIPQGRGTETVIYDAAQWRAAGVPEPHDGWTWEEWADRMRALARETGKPGSVDPGQSEDAFEVWLHGRGKTLYTPDGDLGFTVADLTRFWTFTDELRREGAVSPATETTQLDGSVENTPLGRGTAIADFNWDAPAIGYQEIVGEGLTLGPMPTGEDGTVGQYFKPAMFLGAADSSAHPREAALLIDFLMNDREAAEILGATRSMPVHETNRAEVVPGLEGFDRTIAEYHDSVESELADPPQAPPAGDAALQATFQRDYDQVAFGRLSPREAAEQYVTQARAELRP